MSLAHVVPVLAVLTVAPVGAASAQQSAYVELLGTDTMSVEVFTRLADRIEGRLLLRSPATRVAAYVAYLASDGSIARLEVSYTTPPSNPEGPAAEQVATVIEGDSALHARGGERRGMAIPVNTIPVVSKNPIPIAFIEHAIGRWRAGGGGTYSFAVVAAGGSRVTSNAVTRHTADTVALDFFGHPMYVAVDGAGVVRGLTGRATTLKVETRRVDAATVDLDALAADFAARDARGAGMGVASPRAEVQVTAGGADFTVDYSRPAKRGRRIWGGLVPYGTVWRTGANRATHFTTSRDLQIGDARVPAGTYTLWTLFTAEAATLIINSETGQWGTAYNAAHDHARVALTGRHVTPSVERFTISVEDALEGALLKLAWDDSEYSVPVRVLR